METNTDTPLSIAPSPAFAGLREALLRADYTSATIDTLLYGPNEGRGAVLEIPVALRRVRGDSPLETLVRLFRLRAEVPVTAAQEALAPATLEELAATGLITISTAGVRSGFNLQEYLGLYLVSDRNRSDQGDLAANHVTGVNSTSTTLAVLTVRRSIESALDLGTGCGVQALLAARHARRVVATDTNPRCLNFTAFNALLNGFTSVECRLGSFFEPVAGEQFDLIVTNPPFVISPETRYAFRDGGQAGDSFMEQVTRQVPNYLRPGGLSTVIGNWVVAPDGPWEAPVQQWLGDAGCDVVALLYSKQDPLSYAAKWLKPQCLNQPDEYEPGLDRWLAYYEAHGVRSIASGALLLRRRPVGGNWFHALAAPGQYNSACGGQLDQLFQVHDYLRSLPSEMALLDRRLRLDGPHQLEQVFDRNEGGYQLRHWKLSTSDGLPRGGVIDSEGVRILVSCDGRHTLRELLAPLADEQGTTVAAFAEACLPTVRNLLLTGFLTPMDL